MQSPLSACDNILEFELMFYFSVQSESTVVYRRRMDDKVKDMNEIFIKTVKFYNLKKKYIS